VTVNCRLFRVGLYLNSPKLWTSFFPSLYSLWFTPFLYLLLPIHVWLTVVKATFIMAPLDKKNAAAVEEVEMFDAKLTTIPTEHIRSDSEDEDSGIPIDRVQTSMNKTKWIACIALCVCYTTAFQQHMCTSSIVKHIDAALGMTRFLRIEKCCLLIRLE
jgi:hypothetical protein